jgi:hypothetical protein
MVVTRVLKVIVVVSLQLYGGPGGAGARPVKAAYCTAPSVAE